MRPDIVAGPIDRKCSRANGSADEPAWLNTDDDPASANSVIDAAHRVSNRKRFMEPPKNKGSRRFPQPGTQVPRPRHPILGADYSYYWTSNPARGSGADARWEYWCRLRQAPSTWP